MRWKCGRSSHHFVRLAVRPIVPAVMAIWNRKMEETEPGSFHDSFERPLPDEIFVRCYLKAYKIRNSFFYSINNSINIYNFVSVSVFQRLIVIT